MGIQEDSLKIKVNCIFSADGSLGVWDLKQIAIDSHSETMPGEGK